jgi:hypothetical protein
VPIYLTSVSFCQEGVHLKEKEKRPLTCTRATYWPDSGRELTVLSSCYLFVLTRGGRYPQGQRLQEVVDASQERAKVLLHGRRAFVSTKDLIKLYSDFRVR